MVGNFLKGLGFGIACCALWVGCSIIQGIADAFGDVPPIPAEAGMVIGFFGMFLFPIYYWFLAPIRERISNKRRVLKVGRYRIYSQNDN